MADDRPQTLMCTIVAVDSSNDFSYLVCSVCEKPLPNSISVCKFCNRKAINSSSFASKRLFRLLMSIASDTRVFRVICFDRAAKVLFGCSAGEFFDFAKLHPFAAANAGRILEGEMCRMTLAKPKNVANDIEGSGHLWSTRCFENLLFATTRKICGNLSESKVLLKTERAFTVLLILFYK